MSRRSDSRAAITFVKQVTLSDLGIGVLSVMAMFHQLTGQLIRQSISQTLFGNIDVEIVVTPRPPSFIIANHDVVAMTSLRLRFCFVTCILLTPRKVYLMNIYDHESILFRTAALVLLD